LRKKCKEKQQLFVVVIEPFFFEIYFIFVVKRIMDDDEDDLNHSDSIKIKSIVGQQNDEVIESDKKINIFLKNVLN